MNSARAASHTCGVTTRGIIRHADPGLIAERRMAEADQAAQSRLADFFNRLEALVGTPSDGARSRPRIADFETSLVSAASRPDLPGRLNQVFQDAQEVARTFVPFPTVFKPCAVKPTEKSRRPLVSSTPRCPRCGALNSEFPKPTVLGNDISALQDQRQLLIDEISEIVPVKEIPRDLAPWLCSQVEAQSSWTAAPPSSDFTATHVIVPHMTQSGGLLVRPRTQRQTNVHRSGTGPLRGGRLSALFQIRDEFAVEAQGQLDAAARGLYRTLQDAGLDATRAPGDPGLFTDAGAVFLPANETGLSARLEINAAVAPRCMVARPGGCVMVLGAAAPGPVRQFATSSGPAGP